MLKTYNFKQAQVCRNKINLQFLVILDATTGGSLERQWRIAEVGIQMHEQLLLRDGPTSHLKQPHQLIYRSRFGYQAVNMFISPVQLDMEV